LARLLLSTIGAISLHAAAFVAATLLPARASDATIDIDAYDPPLAGTLEDLPADSDHVSPAIEGADLPSRTRAADPPSAALPPSKTGNERDMPKARPSARAKANAAQSAGGPAGSEAARPAGLFGAIGDRSAADFATAFTRAFPQAASTDPQWAQATFGSAGTADLVITLDEGGHVDHTEIRGAPSAALRAGISRTMSLIGRRPFTSRARVTTLHLSSKVTRDEIHDGLHGDVFAIGASFTGSGHAFFALAIGRRIDLDITAK